MFVEAPSLTGATLTGLELSPSVSDAMASWTLGTTLASIVAFAGV